ncbi:hypothetical protein [Gilvimarinus polysaccharolyticus]|uniref:hypothetical protein n=1 Tax=Gilvimarinus polysaccharolyticus TaxID=863921 RepID=UPI0012F76063|nr:hypothetical protein [Gilvimarinus polysaccharolyticus]
MASRSAKALRRTWGSFYSFLDSRGTEAAMMFGHYSHYCWLGLVIVCSLQLIGWCVNRS